MEQHFETNQVKFVALYDKKAASDEKSMEIVRMIRDRINNESPYYFDLQSEEEFIENFELHHNVDTGDDMMKGIVYIDLISIKDENDSIIKHLKEGELFRKFISGMPKQKSDLEKSYEDHSRLNWAFHKVMEHIPTYPYIYIMWPVEGKTRDKLSRIRRTLRLALKYHPKVSSAENPITLHCNFGLGDLFGWKGQQSEARRRFEEWMHHPLAGMALEMRYCQKVADRDWRFVYALKKGRKVPTALMLFFIYLDEKVFKTNNKMLLAALLCMFTSNNNMIFNYKNISTLKSTWGKMRGKGRPDFMTLFFKEEMMDKDTEVNISIRTGRKEFRIYRKPKYCVDWMTEYFKFYEFRRRDRRDEKKIDENSKKNGIFLGNHKKIYYICKRIEKIMEGWFRKSRGGC